MKDKLGPFQGLILRRQERRGGDITPSKGAGGNCPALSSRDSPLSLLGSGFNPVGELGSHKPCGMAKNKKEMMWVR